MKRKQTQRQIEAAHMRAVEAFADHARIARKPKRILVYTATGQPVTPGDVVHTFRDSGAVVVEIVEPHTPASSGRVVLRIGGEESAAYYPSVIGAEWR